MTVIENSTPLVNALAFAARGHSILPLFGIDKDGCICGNVECRSKGKHPISNLVPHGKDDAATDPKQIREWFDEHPDMNYGICADLLPTIDIDPRNGGDDTWRELTRKHYDVHTWRVRTGGGGQHIMHGAGADPVSCGKLGKGVDVKGIGGYIVGVGSLHESGKHYTWYNDCHPSKVDLKAVQRWVTDKLAKPKWGGAPRPAEFYNELVAPAVNGERHDRVAALVGHLFGSAFPNRGVLLALVMSHVRHTYPDLDGFDDDEIVRIARDLARNDYKKRAAA
jgi:hypothetical protein